MVFCFFFFLEIELGGLNYFEEIFWRSFFFGGEKWQLGDVFFKK
jgi:hypothetical protein